jgi:hypothetical protein
LVARLDWLCTKRTRPRGFIAVSAASTVRSSKDTTGCREVLWLQARMSALAVMGYSAGVVRSFSRSAPSTRPSSKPNRAATPPSPPASVAAVGASCVSVMSAR